MSTDVTAEQRDTVERLVGTVVSEKYRVDRLLGRGGMGAVFQATNVSIGKRVALKFLNREAARDRDAASRFQREALAASVVESAHIVQIFDSGTSADGLPFLVMELLSGEDLRAKLKRESTLSIEEASNIAAQVLRALMRAHSAGIVHRDLKPDNIFLCRRDDDSLFVKIVDFGISKLGRSTTLDTLTRRGTVLGTAFYMSPEQAQAYEDIDGRTDLFSVGAILFECLAGRPPQVGPTYEAVLIAICTRDADDVRGLAPAVPEALASVIKKALARDRTCRYQSAAEMLDALLAAVPAAFVAPFGATPSGSTFQAVGASPVESPAAFASTSRAPSAARRRKAGSLALASVALLTGFAVTALLVLPERTRPAPDRGAPSLPSGAVRSDLPSSAVARPALFGSSEPALTAASASPASAAAASASAPARVPDAEPSTRPSLKAARRERSPTVRAGIAKGLELSTKGP